MAVAETPETLVTLAAAALVGQVAMGEMFRVTTPEELFHLREDPALLLEVAETQVIREIRQRQACLGLTFRVVPQELAGMAGL